MNKNTAIIHYLTAISIFERWLDLGILSEEDFTKINALIADKYCLSKNSIYR
jgi:hypothetical protein